MGNNCNCGHCHHDHDEDEEGIKESGHCGCGHSHSVDGHLISHDDMEKLMKAIEEAGYKATETADGEITISQ